MPGEATETVPVTEQEMQQPQVETGSYILTSHACNSVFLKKGVLELSEPVKWSTNSGGIHIGWLRGCLVKEVDSAAGTLELT